MGSTFCLSEPLCVENAEVSEMTSAKTPTSEPFPLMTPSPLYPRNAIAKGWSQLPYDSSVLPLDGAIQCFLTSFQDQQTLQESFSDKWQRLPCTADIRAL